MKKVMEDDKQVGVLLTMDEWETITKNKTQFEEGMYMPPEGQMIPDLLAWQEEISRHGLGMNMRGSDRFWNNVQFHLQTRVDVSGAPPPMGRLFIYLTETAGLLITASSAHDPDDINAGCLDVCFASEDNWMEVEP